MILQALVSYYESLVAAGDLYAPGWSKQKVSYAMELDDNGEIVQVYPLLEERGKGKKKSWKPQDRKEPSPVKRTSGAKSNFLCDHSGYLLGVKAKEDPEYNRKCFIACRTLHQEVLATVNSPPAKALLAYFEKWDPTTAENCPALQNVWQELISAKGNLIFFYHGRDVCEDPDICKAWEKRYWSSEEDIEMPCLVTGEIGPVERVHPGIRGMLGTTAAESALVSFNSDSFCSYGRKQSYNAPTSKYVAFAYTSALNYMFSKLRRKLENDEKILWLGDMVVLCWAINGEEAYYDVLNSILGEQCYSDANILEKIQKLMQGEFVTWDKTKLDPSMKFYILGISPNKARLSVRFFLCNTFGAFLQNVQAHYDRMEIIRNENIPFDNIPIWRMLQEAVNPNSENKASSYQMTGNVLQAVLTNTRYPVTLLNGVNLRIRADRRITWERAATIKAYYLQNPHPSVPKEVLTVSLNRENKDVPYCLGRLFATLEYIQSSANPNLNTTIKDRYFSAASSKPAMVYPNLVNLAQAHLKKLYRDKKGLAIKLDGQMREIMDKLPCQYPAKMTLQEQGVFQLGYYHQINFREDRQEENKNV